MSEWQPIDTAPKDGTRILLFWPSWTYEIQNKGYRPEISIGWWTENHRLKVSDDWDAQRRREFADEFQSHNIEGACYFTDQHEMDCYGQAQRHNWPTKWMPMPGYPADFVTRDFLKIDALFQ